MADNLYKGKTAYGSSFKKKKAESLEPNKFGLTDTLVLPIHQQQNL